MPTFSRVVALTVAVEAILTPTPAGAFTLEANPTEGGDELQIYMPDDLRADTMILKDVEYTLDGGTTVQSLGVDWCGRYSIPVTPGAASSVQIRGVFDGGGGSSIRPAWTEAQTATPMGPSIGFGADTRAGEGGYPLPAGVTSITADGGTGLTVSGGFIVPAADGVTPGTITTDGGNFEIVTFANSESVRDRQELKDRSKNTSLVRGTSRILIRGDDAALINPTAERWDLTPDTEYAGTDGYVVIGQHPGEKRPVVRHVGVHKTSSATITEFWLQFEDIDFRAALTGLDPDYVEVCLNARAACEHCRVLRCTFDNVDANETNRADYWDVAINGTNDTRGWRVEKCQSRNFQRHIRTFRGMYIYGNDFSRWTADAIQCQGGTALMFNRFHDLLVGNAPETATSTTPGALTTFTSAGGQTWQYDLYIVITDATGDFAAHILEQYKAEGGGGTARNGVVDIPLNSTGYSGEILAFEYHTLHHDCFQTQRLYFSQPGDGVHYSPYGDRFDTAVVGNLCHFGPSLESYWYYNLQSFLLQNANAHNYVAEHSRVLNAFNISVVSPTYHTQVFNISDIIYLFNTAHDGRPPAASSSKDSGLWIREGSPTGDLRASIVAYNILQDFKDEDRGTPQHRNVLYTKGQEFDVFADPTYEGQQSVIGQEFQPKSGYEHAGTIGPRFDWAAREVHFPPMVFNGLLSDSGGTLTPSVMCPFADGTIHYAVANDGTTMDADDIIGASVGGSIVAAGTQASVPDLQDLPTLTPGAGTYTLWTVLVAGDDGERSDVDQSPAVTI